jgi:hypothetical protein
MKIRKRSTPLDMLAFDHHKHSVNVSTHHQSINVTIRQDDRIVLQHTYTPEQFISLLMRDAQ